MTQIKKTPNFIEKLATAKLAEIREKSSGVSSSLHILDFIPAVTPKFVSPTHLAPIAEQLEKIFEGPQMLTFAAPPRHGKSELIFHFIAKYLSAFPDRFVAYVTYTATLAEKRSLQIKDICGRAGVSFDRKFSSRSYWATSKGGGLLARGPEGALTGEGVHLMIVDDPYRDRAEAESTVQREKLMDWWSDVVSTRIEPGGSIVVFHTRWSENDLIGTLVNEHGWPHTNLKAIGDNGKALWPERYELEHFERLRKANEFSFASLYQGEPRPKGGSLFNGTNLYTEEQLRQTKLERFVIGVDCAYTAKTHADFSVAVVLAVDALGDAYVIDVRRLQCEAPRFAQLLKELRLTYNSPTIYWYIGGTEKAVVQTFRDSFGVPIKSVPAKEDKYVRATAAAAAWNTGRIRIPQEHRGWKDAFVSEILTFSGVGDKHDDQVDALAAAFIPSASRKTFRGNIHVPIF